ncbi:hypothetical protein [Pseudomonas fragi]|uniref:Uncharacterized protein n=1 Tax=Pseudomonas fragi TaxID=296 RepID=A0A9Q5FTT0_PSEFR|nr:hypothetical protein [Pseudomonas fragi]NNB52493.1 hypothetical protein [Pseudomonas fragi]
MDTVNDAFSRFFSARDTSAPKEEIRAKKAKLNIEKHTLEMLEASLAQFDGMIPQTFIKRVADSEARINTLESEIQSLEGALTIEAETLEITTYQDILDLYETEEGRLKLNTFFISRGILFEVTYEKELMSVGLNVKIKNEATELYTHEYFYFTKDPLKKFGIPDLSHIIK